MNNREALRIGVGLAIVTLLLVGCRLQETAQPHLAFVEVQKDGVGGVDGLRGVWSLAISPDGKHVYAAGYRDDAVAVFSRNESTGKLGFVEVQKEGVGGLDGIGGPCSVAVSPDGAHVYVAGHWDHTLAAFRRDKTTGRLTFVEAQRDGVGGVDGLHVINWVTVSPDGKHVYAASYRDYAVTVFSRDAVTGELTFVEAHKDGLNGANGLYGAFFVAVSPDGEHVYVAGRLESALAVFRRDSITGRLTFVEVVRDDIGGVDGLGIPSSLALSLDGKYVYVASVGDHAVAVFSRDAATGRLTFVEAQRDGINGVDGLQMARSVAISPNGRYVYAAGWGDHAVAVFSRDETTGQLTFVEAQWDGVDGVDGLQGASCVTVSLDGKGQHVYVAGNWVQAVSVFNVLDP